MLKKIGQGLADSERGWRKLYENERRVNTLLRGGRPRSPWQSFKDDMVVELKVAGHQLLLIIGIAIANIIFFGFLILIFPYVWNWFWSFP